MNFEIRQFLSEPAIEVGQFGLVVGILAYYARGGGFDPL
jgi:hypothetical protein